MAAAEVTVGLHVSDHGLDGAAASQFALDDAEDAALLAGDDEDAAWIGRAVTPTSLVDIGTLDLAAGKPFGVFDHDAQRVAIPATFWRAARTGRLARGHWVWRSRTLRRTRRVRWPCPCRCTRPRERGRNTASSRADAAAETGSGWRARAAIQTAPRGRPCRR